MAYNDRTLAADRAPLVRSSSARRHRAIPGLENLEGRQLLSGVVGGSSHAPPGVGGPNPNAAILFPVFAQASTSGATTGIGILKSTE